MLQNIHSATLKVQLVGITSGHQIVGPVGPVGHLHLWSDSGGPSAGPNVR